MPDIIHIYAYFTASVTHFNFVNWYYKLYTDTWWLVSQGA